MDLPPPSMRSGRISKTKTESPIQPGNSQNSHTNRYKKMPPPPPPYANQEAINNRMSNSRAVYNPELVAEVRQGIEKQLDSSKTFQKAYSISFSHFSSEHWYRNYGTEELFHYVLDQVEKERNLVTTFVCTSAPPVYCLVDKAKYEKQEMEAEAETKRKRDELVDSESINTIYRISYMMACCVVVAMFFLFNIY